MSTISITLKTKVLLEAGSEKLKVLAFYFLVFFVFSLFLCFVLLCVYIPSNVLL